MRYRSIIVLILILVFSFPVSNLSVTMLRMSPGILDPIGTTLGDVSNSGIQGLRDVSDIHFQGIYSNGQKSGFGTTMGLKDIDGDGVDDLYFGYGSLPSGAGLTAFKGGEGHIMGEVDMEEVEPDISLSLMQSTWMDAGDADGDGDQDLIMGGYKGSGRLYLNRGDGTYSTSYLMAGGSEDPFNYQYGDHVLLEDLDGDGRDEAIYGYFYNDPNTPNPQPHQVNIKWGTGELTKMTRNGFRNFGSSMASGDIDGDGWKDLVLGGYNWYDNDRGEARAGSVLVFFNASRLRSGSIVIDPREACDTWIMGSTGGDLFGYTIRIEDINSDGKDDILVGSPGSDDGVSNEYNTGAIHVFLGGISTSFPAYMLSNQGADQIIFGSTGSYTGETDYPGDQIGRVFDTTDLDGDGEVELIVAMSGRHTEGNQMHVGMVAGAVTVHETREAFPSTGGYVKLSYPSGIFTVEGNDPRDVTGWQIATGDFNDDNVSDLLISVPGGDGNDNLRQECGEVFLILGNNLRIEGLSITGEGVFEGSILPGEGPVVIRTNFRHTIDPLLVEETVITLDPTGSDLSIIVNRSGCRIENDMWNSITVTDFRSGETGSTGWMECILDIGLKVPFIGEMDILITLNEINGGNVSFLFEGPVSVNKDLIFKGDPSYLAGETATDHIFSWLKEDTLIEIEDLSLVNSMGGNPIPMDRIGLRLTNSNNGMLDETFTDSRVLSFDSNELSSGKTYIEPVLNDIHFPPGYPVKYLPKLPKRIEIELRLDDTAPIPPGSLEVVDENLSGEDPFPPGDIPILINSSLGTEYDPGGSGIDHFEISMNGGEFEPVMEVGGLLGTYYGNDGFDEVKMERVDHEIDFVWGEFPPVLNKGIHPYQFSIEWEGWFKTPWEFPFRFRLEGSGSARVEIDGEEVIPWSDISVSRTSSELNMEPESIHVLEIQFRKLEKMTDTGINLKWLEEDGRYWTVDDSYLYHASNLTVVKDDNVAEDILVRARSIDAVGHRSEEITRTFTRDALGPDFIPVSIPEWTYSLNPELVLEVKDRSSGDSEGCGVDTGSIHYRTVTSKGSKGPWMHIKARELNGVVMIRINPTLQEDFKGSIEFRGSDIYGNNATSSLFPVNVDRDPPELDIQGTGEFVITEDEDAILTFRVKDPGGSGVDVDTFEFRYLLQDEVWTEWRPFGTGEDGTDVYISGDVPFSEGEYRTEFRVMDKVGNTGSTDILVIRVDVPANDQLPIPVIKSPVNGSMIRLGEPVILDATGTSDDSSEELSIVWFSNISGYLASGGKGKLYLEKGFHRITMYVDDGLPGHNVSTFVNVEVYDPADEEDGPEDEDGSSDPSDENRDLTWMFVIMILALLVVFGGIGYMLYRRDRGEVRMGIREETEDEGEGPGD